MISRCSASGRLARAGVALGAMLSVLMMSTYACPPARPICAKPGQPSGAAYVSVAQAERVRFAAYDIFIDAGSHALGAYQLEFRADGSGATIVGVEGGEHAAFREAPYYDPAAMQHERVVLAAYSTQQDLPSGVVRVARIHTMIRGNETPAFTLSLTTTATGEGEKFPASARYEQGAGQ